MLVRFYNFDKKLNSTARPTSDPVEVECQIKDNCSILNPILVTSFNPIQYNYVYIESYRRYYFVNDWSYIIGNWELKLEVDTLASYRGTILASNQYILRSASQSNGAIFDSMYPATADLSTSVAEMGTFYTLAGVFCVGIIGSGSSLGITYYLMTPSNFASFMNELLSTTNIFNNSKFELEDQDENITSLSDGIIKSLVNPLQYIKSCMFFPLDQSVAMQLGTSVTGIQIGYWKALSVQARVLTGVTTMQVGPKECTLPKHPQASTRGSFLNCAPYTQYKVVFEPFGTFELPSTDVAEQSTVKSVLSVDFISGDAVLEILYSNLLYNVVRKTAKVGIPIAIGQITNNMLSGLVGLGTSTLSAGAYAMSGNFVQSALSLASGVMNGISSIFPVVSSAGANGSFLEVGFASRIHAKFTNIAPEDNTHYGRPLCLPKTLSELSGYTVIGNPNISLPYSTASEEKAVINMMESGIYIE